jgi:Bacterial antitoxin of ParD toxin-antitoxin type II system and RHH
MKNSSSPTSRKAGLSLLEEHELKMDRLRQAITGGENSGPPTPIDMEDFITEMKARKTCGNARISRHLLGKAKRVPRQSTSDVSHINI